MLFYVVTCIYCIVMFVYSIEKGSQIKKLDKLLKELLESKNVNINNITQWFGDYKYISNMFDVDNPGKSLRSARAGWLVG